MGDRISDIDKTGTNKFRVWTVARNRFELFAKDELEAFTEGSRLIKEKEMESRYIYVCLTIAFLATLGSLTYGCTSYDQTKTDRINNCVKAGKNWVSEADGYSCRDAGSAPVLPQRKAN